MAHLLGRPRRELDTANRFSMMLPGGTKVDATGWPALAAVLVLGVIVLVVLAL